MLNLFGKKTNGGKKQQTTLSNANNVAGFLAKGTVSIKDIIAPSFIEVDFNHLKIDDKFYRTLYVVGYPRYVSANWLYPLITFDHPLYISMYIYPTEAKVVLEDLKRKIAEMEATIEGDIKSGKVVDPTVQVALDDALALQAELAKGAERFFQFGLYITIPADSLEELNRVAKEIDSVISSLLIIAKQATLEMEEGFKSTLPMFYDRLGVWRNIDTTSLAMTFPFATASLTRNEGILYGVNQHDGSLIIFDRFTLENAYEKSTQSVGGEFVVFSANSQYKINPFDLTTVNPEPDELSNKILDLHSLMRVIMGELTPSQDALLDRALVLTYREKGITQDPETFSKDPPLLEDLYKILIGMEAVEARELADRLEKFVKGSAAGIFNNHSNFDIKNTFTVFGIRDLEENLRPVAMYIVLDYIWNRVRRD